jgi:hypothetical protein
MGISMKKSKCTWTENGMTSKEQSQEQLKSYIKGTVYKEFTLEGQTVGSACYCDVLWRMRKNVLRLCPKLWRQKNCLLHHDNPSYFIR